MHGAGSARRAVAYIRTAETSSELAEASEHPPSAQRQAIETWADREHVEIRSWQLDVGVDGATPIAERPGLMAAYQAVRIYGAGMLVAANAERFGHDELVCWLIERAALVEGAQICTADGSRTKTRGLAETDEEPKGYTRGAIDLARAYQRVTVAARIRTVLSEKKARGERVGNVPFGYRLASDGVHTEPDEREQDVIASVRQLSREGLSQRAIVSRLEERGVVGRTGAPLRQTQIAKILRATG